VECCIESGRFPEVTPEIDNPNLTISNLQLLQFLHGTISRSVIHKNYFVIGNRYKGLFELCVQWPQRLRFIVEWDDHAQLYLGLIHLTLPVYEMA